jgi:hypothetical protein
MFNELDSTRHPEARTLASLEGRRPRPCRSHTFTPGGIAGRENNRYSTLNGAASIHACAMDHAARPVEMA